MSPAVSVIMPVFNQEAWLGAAIDSVRAQRLTDWELLIVDDGSNDGSRAVMQRYAALDPDRIRLLSHPAGERRGVAAARNLGIREARGRYVAFLDADDLFLREKLAAEVHKLDATPDAAMLYAPALWRWEDGRRADRVDRIGIAVGRVHPAPELSWRILLERQGDVPCTCAVLIRREAAAACGGFEEGFRLYEDQTLWAKLFLRHGTLVSPTVQSIYRQHAASTSAAAERDGEYDFWRPHPARRQFLEWLAHETELQGVRDGRLRATLRRARLRDRHPKLGRIYSGMSRAVRSLSRSRTTR
ncbi:MAG TPA: glycosyltransferase [Alphaproteobacteria bacterium]